MGAVINSDPHLWGAVVAHVPFVDVLATMLDAILPLTPGEWPEWGNPIEDQAAFELIRSYSPYDNVQRAGLSAAAGHRRPQRPAGDLLGAGQVGRPLRELKTDDNELLLKTNMGAGHGGKSGRFESLRETAEEFAFILWQLGHRHDQECRLRHRQCPRALGFARHRRSGVRRGGRCRPTARWQALFVDADIWRALNRGEHTEAGAKTAFVEAGHADRRRGRRAVRRALRQPAPDRGHPAADGAACRRPATACSR